MKLRYLIIVVERVVVGEESEPFYQNMDLNKVGRHKMKTVVS